MHFSTIRQIFFSPTGTTRNIAETLTTALGGAEITHDLLRLPVENDFTVRADELLVVALPVFAGRLPEYTVQALRHFRGQGGPAVAVVTYGNRAYDDALLELKTELEACNVVVGAAAAFVARHSIIQEVGPDRPDQQDILQVQAFAELVTQKSDCVPVTVPGNMPYRERKPALLQPTPDESCTLCGLCVRRCPVRALRVDNGALVKDAALCMGCAACISVCPTRSQQYRGPQFEGFRAMFVEKFSARKEPEFFV